MELKEILKLLKMEKKEKIMLDLIQDHLLVKELLEEKMVNLVQNLDKMIMMVNPILLTHCNLMLMSKERLMLKVRKMQKMQRLLLMLEVLLTENSMLKELNF